MSKETSIKETLAVIRKALEDDNFDESNPKILLLNKKINDDGTINIINDIDEKNSEIKATIDNKINSLIEKNFEEFIDKKLSDLIDKHLKKKKFD